MSAPPLAAVLFDMDGLLVATEKVWFEVESALVAELGGSWGPADQELLVGGPLERTVEHMIATVPAAAAEGRGTAWVQGRLLEDMVARLRRGPVEWMPGAERLLAEVEAAGVPRALVSSSRRPVVDAVLDAVGRGHFAVTVSGDDVERTKPAPDPYLRAAQLLGVSPEDCAALEDSETGARSAGAAGCATVLVPSIPGVADGVADHRVSSLTEIDLAVLVDLVGAAGDRAASSA